jgi:hypothetical protein
MAMRKIEKPNSHDEDLDDLIDDAFIAELEAKYPGVHFITDDEAMEIVEVEAQKYFGISATEFIDRWKAEDFPKDDRCRAWEVSIFIPHKYR